MPKIQNVLIESSSFIKIGLWRITEGQDELLAIGTNCQYLEDIQNIKSQVRRLEYLATRALLQDMIGNTAEIRHYSSGKPYLTDGRNISISHTKEYVAVAVSDDYNVALDIEYVSDRVCRVANRFLRDDELAETTIQKLLVWCAKETLYKLHSEDELVFEDMRAVDIPNLDSVSSGKFIIQNMKRMQNIAINFIVTDDYVFTFAKENIRK